MTSWTQSDSKLPKQDTHYENEILVWGPITELRTGRRFTPRYSKRLAWLGIRISFGTPWPIFCSLPVFLSATSRAYSATPNASAKSTIPSGFTSAKPPLRRRFGRRGRHKVRHVYAHQPNEHARTRIKTADLWRRRVEVESTTHSAKERVAGFEGREGHRTPFAPMGV